MPAFFRKITSNTKKNSNAHIEQNINPAPSISVGDVPPSLPPLFARFAKFDQPESQPQLSSYFSSHLHMPLENSTPHALFPSHDWDAWKALIDPPPSPCPSTTDSSDSSYSDEYPLTNIIRQTYAAPPVPLQQQQQPQQQQQHNNNNSNNTSLDVGVSHTHYASHSRLTPPSSRSTPRTARVDNTPLHSINHKNMPAIRNPLVVPSTHLKHDHPSPLAPEQSLSQSHNPTSRSLLNQAHSYAPSNTRHPPPPSQDPPRSLQSPQIIPFNGISLQKPASTSSRASTTTQSSSDHSLLTHRTNSGSFTTAFTSTSSIAPSLKQIDVTNLNIRGRSSSAQKRLPLPIKSSTHSTDPTSGFLASTSPPVALGRPSTHRPTLVPTPLDSSLQRNIMYSTTTVTTRSSQPPPSPSALRARNLHTRQSPLVPRPLTHMNVATNPLAPLNSCSLNRSHSAAEATTAPVRKGPLIFSAMTSVSQPDNSVTAPPISPLQTKRAVDRNDPFGYPSPPPERASLDQPNTRRLPLVLSSSGHPSYEVRRVSPPSPAPKLNRAAMMAKLAPDHGGESPKPRVLTKSRSRVMLSSSHKSPVQKPSAEAENTLLLDADPFAMVEGVHVVGKGQVLLPEANDEPKHDEAHPPAVLATPSTPPQALPKSPLTPDSPDNYNTARAQRRGQWLEKTCPPLVSDVIAQQELMSKEAEILQKDEEARLRKEEEKRQKEEEEQRQKEEEEKRRKEEEEEKQRLAALPPTFYPIVKHLSDASLLPHLLTYMTFSDWCSLYGATKEIRRMFESRALREYVLEHFLGTVGYVRWNFEWAEPLALSLKELNDYMRGVSMPTHQYARLAEAYLQPPIVTAGDAIPQIPDVTSLAMTTRAYTRVVLRLRSQVESDARAVARSHISPITPASRGPSTGSSKQAVSSRPSSRTASPTSLHSHGKPSLSAPRRTTLRSPLARLHRAPLLRVFVPSPDGEWLSDSSVIECEAELKRTGVLKLLRVGDVVWDVAVGDEGNLGRMVWDGSYLVDLDYKYSRMGELSPYFHSLAFSPSHFHRVIRTGVNAATNPDSNPIVYIDVSPWGKELAANLQLLQDRATTTTPHGALHSVVRWLHRSTFTIRPPVSPNHPHAYSHLHNLRLPIPNVDGFFIDPGWYGTVVIEAEGTNEGLADFQDRCGPGAFPPRADNVTSKIRSQKEKDSKRVYRVLREKSRPGEIWIRAVREKERVM